MYLKDLSDLKKHNNKFGVIQLDFNRKVDFLISLLAFADVRFPPFDYHYQIKKYSVTLDEWRDWLNQTLIKNDPRWPWKVDNIELKADSRIQRDQDFLRMLKIAPAENLNWANIRAYYIKEITWFDNQYRQVVQEYSTRGTQEEWIQDKRISQDWEIFQTINHSNPNIEVLLTSIKHPKGGINSAHLVYFVNYPVFVKCSIGLNTIIGVPKEPDFDIQSIIDEIERLIRE